MRNSIYLLFALLFLFSKTIAQNTSESSLNLVGAALSERTPDTGSDFSALPVINWIFKTKAPLFSSPVVTDNIIFIGGCDSVLYALDINSGLEKWRFKTRGEIRSTVCTDDSFLYLNGGDGNLYALELLSGRLIWKFATKGERKYDFADYFHSTPVLSKGNLYFGSGDGNLYAINSKSGKLVWKYTTGNIVHTTPAIANNKVYFGSFDGDRKSVV